ncbi:MAG: c-type cytochrome [Planctomycetes bacterium]|nr:c-type cytochrome [Planctomycetota bacterium]
MANLEKKPFNPWLFTAAGAVIVVVLAILIANSPDPKPAIPVGNPNVVPETVVVPETTEDLLAHGANLFARNCATCHGAKGAGDGEAAYLLNPKPRNLVLGQYRVVRTLNGLARREDIYKVITEGMPGSSMPPWDRLSEKDRWALTDYTLSLDSKREKKVKKLGLELLNPVAPPPMDIAVLEHGRSLFQQACALCHGSSGRGDGPQQQFDTEGYPTRPRDLTLGLYKGGGEPEEIFRRIRLGMPGSPMPALGSISDQDAWALTHFVKSLAKRDAQSVVRQKYQTIEATRASGPVPEDPFSDEWLRRPATALGLMPLWWRETRIEQVETRCAYDAEHLWVHLAWDDATQDDSQLHLQSFSDGAAVQLTSDADPPLFAMGARGSSDVRIWFWKASKQRDTDHGFADIQTIHPNMYTAHYQHMKGGPLAVATPFLAEGDAHDPRFLTGRGAGNVVSTPNKQPVESLSAHGIGTVGQRVHNDEGVQGRGVWRDGRYALILRRPLKQSGAKALSLAVGEQAYVAFAVWDGNLGDRNGQKSVTIWHALRLTP